MTLSPLGNGVIEVFNGFQDRPQLSHERLRHQGMGDDDPLIPRQWRGVLDRCKPLVDTLRPAQMMLTKEALKRRPTGELGGFEVGAAFV